MRRDAYPANGQLMMPLRQTTEANGFEVLLIGYLEITPSIYVYIIPWKIIIIIIKKKYKE